MKIEIDLKIILLLILFVLTAQIKLYSIFILFIILHELAHILMGYILGMKITNFRINILGVSAEMYNYNSRKSYIKIITYFAGPIFNLLCAISFYCLNLNEQLKIDLVYTNIILFLFNLLPILPLDGGKILKEILRKIWGNKQANVIMICISKILLVISSFVYSIIILKIKNLAILFLIIYMWYLYSIEARKVNTLKRMYEIIEKS